jgi:hypothetical protein
MRISTVVRETSLQEPKDVSSAGNRTPAEVKFEKSSPVINNEAISKNKPTVSAERSTNLDLSNNKKPSTDSIISVDDDSFAGNESSDDKPFPSNANEGLIGNINFAGSDSTIKSTASTDDTRMKLSESSPISGE